MFAGATSLYGLVAAGVSLFNQSILEERGFDRGVFLTITTLSPLVGLAANLATGWLAGHWSPGRLLAAAMLLLAAALLCFPLVQSLWQVYLYAVAMGAAGGMVTVIFFGVWGQAFGTVHLGKIQGAAQMMTVVASAAGQLEHRLGQDVPERAPFADGRIDEVRLRGSLNMPLAEGQRTRLLAEARRVLRPGGRLFVHVLTAESPLAGKPELPGPAAAVQYVPVDADVVGLAEAAGFERVRLLKFDAKPCFVREGVPMRETQLEAWRPSADTGPSVTVVYKGPFRELRDDLGHVFPRGRRVTVTAAVAERLRSPEWAAQFLILG